MIRKTTWILLAVLILLVAFAWLLQSGRLSLGRQAEATSTTEPQAELFTFDAATVRSLQIEAVGAPSANATATAGALATALATLTRTPTSTPTIVVTGTVTAAINATPAPVEYTKVAYEKGEDGTWTIVEPQGTLFDPSLVESAVSQLVQSTAVSTLKNQPPFETIGIDPPRYRITLTLEDGSQHVILVGSRTVTGSGYYLQVDGGPVAIANQFVVDGIVELLENPGLNSTETPEVAQTSTIPPTATLTALPTIGVTAVISGTLTPTP